MNLLAKAKRFFSKFSFNKSGLKTGWFGASKIWGRFSPKRNVPVPADVSDLDLRIIALHRSTKTLFPFFRKPHNHLRAKSRLYYNWHLNPHVHKVHYSTASLALISAFSFCLYLSLPLISRADTLTTTQTSEPKITTEVINPETSPDKFFLNDAEGNPTKSYELTEDESGTKIKTKSATEAGFQQLVLNGNQSQLYDGDKLVAIATVKTQEQDKDGEWQAVGVKKQENTPPNLPSQKGGAENTPITPNSPTSLNAPTPHSLFSVISTPHSLFSVISTPRSLFSVISTPRQRRGWRNLLKDLSTMLEMTSRAIAEDTSLKEQKSTKVTEKTDDKVTVDNSTTLENGEELKVQAEVGHSVILNESEGSPGDSSQAQNDNIVPLKKQTFTLANKNKKEKRIYWEVALKDFDITEDSSVVIPDASSVILNDSEGSLSSSEPTSVGDSSVPQNDSASRSKSYNSTIIDCSDYLGPMTWKEIAETNTVLIYFDEEGTTEDIIVDPILTVTEPANQISVDDGTHKWIFDTSVAGAPKYYYDDRIGGGADNLASTESDRLFIGPMTRLVGTVSGVTQTLIENTPTRVKVRTQGAYSTSPTAVDNTYTIYPDGRAFWQYSFTTSDIRNFLVVTHHLSTVPQVKDHNDTYNTFVISDTTNNNYAGMAVVPFTTAEFGDVGSWNVAASSDSENIYKNVAGGTYTGNMAIDFSNYRATTTTRDALLAEYRTPATLANFDAGSQTGDGFNEAEGAYTITADASGDAQFDLTVGASTRIKPAFYITGATRAEDTYQVFIGATHLTKGIDYNLSKPTATTATLQLLSSYAADITDLQISDGSVTGTVNKIWDGGGGVDTNWSTALNWSDDAVPGATDNVMFGATSTNNCAVDAGSTPTIASLTIAPGYSGTITLAKDMTISGDFSLEGGTFNAATFTINIGGNYSRVGGTFTAGTSTLNMNATATGKTFTAGGQTYNNITFNGVGGGWTLQDGLTTGSTSILTLTNGSLNTNGQTLNIGRLLSDDNNTRVLTLGSSQITLAYSGGSTALSFLNGDTLTFNCDTSLITLTGANVYLYLANKTFNNVVVNGATAFGFTNSNNTPTFANFTVNTGDSKTAFYTVAQPIIVTGTLTLAGFSSTSRLLVQSYVLGTARTITAAAVSLSNTDFRDITFAGGMAGTGASASIGDCGGNSGVNWNTAAFPTAADTETWNGSTAAWSSSNWVGGAVSRVPLPQDTVVLAGTNTVTADMPRLGKDISFTAGQATPLTLANAVTSYGSVNFTNSGVFTPNTWTFEGRMALEKITSAGKTFSQIIVSAYGGTYTLQDAFIGTSSISLNNGTFNANNNNVTVPGFSSNNSNVRTLTMGSGIWTLNRTTVGNAWNTAIITNLTLNYDTSTIAITDTGAAAKTFAGGGKIYNNISITGGGAGAVIFEGANTFNDFTIGAPKTVTFPSTVTTTINGTFTANGTSANLITINSSSAGSAATITHTGNTATMWNSIRDIISTNPWTASFSFDAAPVSVTNITFPTYKRVADGGGDFSAGATWDGGVVPTSAEDIYADATSGQLTVDTSASNCRSFDFQTYDDTLTITLNGYLLSNAPDNTTVNNYMGSGMTIVDQGGRIYLTSVAVTNAVSNFYSNGKTLGYVHVGTSGRNPTVNLRDNLTLSSTRILYVNTGTFNTNNFTLNIGKFESSNSTTRAINLGSSSITVTGDSTVWNFITTTGLTFDSGTSTVTFTGAVLTIYFGGRTFYDVVFTDIFSLYVSGLASVHNLTWNGYAHKSSTIVLGSTSPNVSGLLTVDSDSSINRLLVTSQFLGTPVTLTAAAVSLSNVDFRDITFAGTMTGYGASSSIGDAGGNSGVGWAVGGNFPTAATTQTWTNANGGSWSTAANWTSRVPLPQDDVNLGSAFGTSKTVTADMPRLGKDISFSAATPLTLANAVTSYGSLSFANAGTFTPSTYTWTFESQARSGTQTLTSNNKSFRNVVIQVVGATLQLQDALSTIDAPYTTTYGISLSNGTFDANNFTVTTNMFGSTGTNTRALMLGTGTWTINGSAAGGQNSWNVTSSLSLTSTGSNIVYNSNGQTVRFAGGGLIYNNLSVTGSTIFLNNNTFNNLTLTAGKTVTFPSTVTTTINGTFTANGTSANIITLNSSTATSAATISHAGNFNTSWNSIRDITSNGGGTWTASYSTNVSGNSGITFPTWKSITVAGGNWGDGTTWSDGIVPTASDDVAAISTSGSVTVNTTANVKSFAASAYAGTITAGAQTINVAGDWTWGAGTFTANTSTLNMNATSTGKTFTAGGQTYREITFGGNGGGWTLQDALTMGGTLNFTRGTLNTNGQTIILRRLLSGGAAGRTLTFGASNITVTMNDSTAWDMSTATGLTFNAGTSVITFTAASPTLAGGGQTFNTVNFTGSGTPIITGANTFATLTRTGTAVKTDGFQINADQTVSGTLTINGNSATNRILATSNTLGTARTITAANVSLSNVDFRDITGAGYGSVYSPAHNDTYVKATTKQSTSRWPYFATNPTKSLTGSSTSNSWASASGSTTSQRFHIDLSSTQVITRIYYENYHHNGALTDNGAKEFTLWGSNTAGDFADLTYANDGSWTQLTTSVSQFDQHVASDVVDPKYITVTNDTAYRYYAFKFANNWTGGSYLGLRRIELQTSSFTGTSLGDAGGNSGITFTEATTQTWDGTTGNWSDSTKWTSRVPLPQDTVVLAGTNVVTADMPRLGKDISFSGATPLTLSVAVTSYGSLNLTGMGAFAGEYIWTFESQARSGTSNLVANSKTFYNLTTANVGSTLQLSGDMWVTMNFTNSAGTFNAGSGTLTIGYNGNSVVSVFTVNGTFNAETGTVQFGYRIGNYSGITITADGQVFNNVIFTRTVWAATITEGTSITVNGLLTLVGGSVNTGTINANGNVSVASSFTHGGTAILNINGGVGQAVTIDGGVLPNTVFNNANLNVTPTASVRFVGLTLTAGTLNSGANTVTIGSNSNIATSFIINGGTFNADTGTVQFGRDYGDYSPITITADEQVFNNVIFVRANNHTATITEGTSITVNGLFTKTLGYVSTGTINLKGNLVQTGGGGNAIYNFNGTGTQTISGAGAGTSFTSGQVTVNSGATLQLGATTTITKLAVASGGTLDLNGYGFTSTTHTNAGNLLLQGSETVTTPLFTAAAGTVNFLLSNTYNDLILSPSGPVTLNFTAGKTTTIGGTFIADGTAGNLVTIKSSIAGSAAYLVQASGINVLDYASVRDIMVNPGGSQYPPVQNDTYVKATSKYSTSAWPYFATDSTKSLVGDWSNNAWLSGNTQVTNQRFHVDLGAAKTITRVYYESYHNGGTMLTGGAKNFTLWGSNTAGDFADLTYADDGTWTQLTTSVSQFSQHTASNVVDPKYITVTNSTAYRYYALKFADNWGESGYMGVRRIELQTEGASDAKWYLANTSTDVSGNFGWLSDATPPTDPDTITADVDATPIVDESWISQAGTIDIEFSGATDPDSGILGYYTYWGSGSGGEPIDWQAQIADPQTYSVPITTADDGTHFYFRVKTKDAVGNIGDAVTLFDFGYDITLPTRPTFVAADPPGYTTTNDFDFSWPAGTDPAGPGGDASGIKWYEYKRATDGAWSHTADAATRTVTGVLAYQEGANVFYVRTIDNADNTSPTYQQVTYYWSGVAPAKPTNLSVSPATSATNSFTISWDKSVTGVDDPPVVGYYYSINAVPTINNVTYVASTAASVSIGPDAYATQQGENTVYVLGVNAAGNLSFENDYVVSATFTAQTSAPPAPVNVGLSDSSNRAYSTWSLTANWQAASNMDESTFDHYAIERSTDGTNFTALSTTTATAYIDVDGLNNTTTYSYRVKAVDNAGKESAASSTVQRMPTGNYLTPPTILSAPAVSSIKSSSATISWTTDRASSSVVRYGKAADGTFEASSGQFDATVNHSVTLFGLDPSTLYYFQVQSLDEYRDYTPDTAYSSAYNFRTIDAPAISATTISNITLTSADIAFDTTTVSTSTIYYGPTNSYGSSIEDISGASTTKHSVRFTSLTPGSTYHFRIEGTDIDDNPIVSDDYQFETLPLPQIDNLKVEAISGTPQSAFKASWTTNVPCSTVIRYSIAGANPKEAVKAKLESGHSIEVTGLEDNTTYSIVASGRDELGNLAESQAFSFTTPYDTRPPILSGITIETSMVGSGATTKAQIIVGFKTDEPTSAKIEYGEGTDDSYTGSTTEESGFSLERSMVVSNLNPSTTYHLKVIVKDEAGNTAESGSQVFITNEGKKSAWELIKDTLFNIFGFWMKEYE